MRLTRRGWALVAVVVGAEFLAVLHGARALNAIAAPAVIGLAAGAVQVARAERPTVDRGSVPPGFPGDRREVALDVAGGGVATIIDRTPEGVVVDPAIADATGSATLEATLPTEFTYDIEFAARGRHEVGPTLVQVRDVLGVVTTEYDVKATTTALVYPPVYQVAGREALLREVLDREAVERDEFDELREYVPGDPLRDVHWKSTAKNPESMFVTEFADRRIDDTVVLAASSEGGAADAMAAAAASVGVMAIDAGVSVELRAPSVSVPTGGGVDHRDRLLRALALTDGGHPSPEDMEDVDIHVHADDEGVSLTLGPHTHSFEEMTVSRANPLADREVSA
ncbi:MAG: DUF58 domain-containing protein [Haloarculaceae archaeon]